jgi:hypothetical protein
VRIFQPFYVVGSSRARFLRLVDEGEDILQGHVILNSVRGRKDVAAIPALFKQSPTLFPYRFFCSIG